MSWRSEPPDDRALSPIDEATAESLLTGGEVRSDLEPVATFLRALRDTARRRVAPGARLAAHMAGGRYVRQGMPVRWSGARSATAPAAPTTRRLLAWASAGGLVAAMLGTATAGFARALPEPAQQRFEVVVKTVTGYDFPEAPDRRGAADNRPDTEDTDDAGAARAGPAEVDRGHPGRPAGAGPDRERRAPFGAWVRGLGPGPGHGEVVSARARTWSGGAGPGATATPDPAATAGGKPADGPPGRMVAAGRASAGPAAAKPRGAGTGGPPVPASPAGHGGPPTPGDGPPAGVPAPGGR